MKKQMKSGMFALNVIIGALLLSGNANAQIPQTGEAAPATAVIGEGNIFEKEVSPLLREISRKKTVLELRKLDRELEKLDEEAMKAQLEKDKMLSEVEEKMKGFDKKEGNGTATPVPFTGNGPMLKSGGASPLQFNPVGGTLPMPAIGAGQPQVLTASQSFNPAFGSNIAKASDAEPVYEAPRVFMIYGMEDNLHAKIAIGEQGGYVVKKGDTLPDGRLIVDIKPNYLEVKIVTVKSKTKKTVEKIFVTGAPSKSTTGSASVSSPARTAVDSLVPPPTMVPTQNIMPTNTVPSFAPAAMNVPVTGQRPVVR